jgi:hypothetical protein
LERVDREKWLEDLYASANGSLRIHLSLHGDTFQVHISGRRAVFEYLADGVSEVLDGADCHFSIAPFSRGGGWFGRTIEKDADEWYARGSRISDDGGIYIHLQPCDSGMIALPGGGVGWLCFPSESEGVSPSDVTWDPAYLLIEGRASELAAIKDLLLKAANGHSFSIDRVSLQQIFGNAANIGIELAMEPI